MTTRLAIFSLSLIGTPCSCKFSNCKTAYSAVLNNIRFHLHQRNLYYMLPKLHKKFHANTNLSILQKLTSNYSNNCTKLKMKSTKQNKCVQIFSNTLQCRSTVVARHPGRFVRVSWEHSRRKSLPVGTNNALLVTSRETVRSQRYNLQKCILNTEWTFNKFLFYLQCL